MNDIIKPTLLIDTEIMLANLDRMIAKSKANKLAFRPHFKTHQSRKIARLYRERGIDRITVSSVDMARYFAEDGWNDITIAFPTNVRERGSISHLHKSISLNLIVDNRETINAIDSWGLDGIGLFIEVDAGYHRTGADIKDVERLRELVDQVSSSDSINWKGFLIHNGHTYKARGKEHIISAHRASLELFRMLNQYKEDFPEIIISVGDTPAFSAIDRFSGFDEMRPGNFIFYDIAQWQIGSCELTDVAVCMACPIVGVYPDREELVIYGGGVHFSKDRIDIDGTEVFGFPVGLNVHGWDAPEPNTHVSSLSQEHGIIKLPRHQLSQYKVGDLIGVLPVHSCLTAEAMKSYRTVAGEELDHF
jgi:D-serine deaminase-like pyridoxal phosphate-dependent protein